MGCFSHANRLARPGLPPLSCRRTNPLARPPAHSVAVSILRSRYRSDPGNMQRQEPHHQPPPPPRPRPQYRHEQQHEQNRARFHLQHDQQYQAYQQYQQHLQQQQSQQAQYQSPYPAAEEPRRRQEQRIISPSRSPQASTTSMSPSGNTLTLSYSSLMKDQNASEPEAGMENIQIDEEWIARNGAFACIWALTYKLPGKEAEEMAQAIMAPPSYTKRG